MSLKDQNKTKQHSDKTKHETSCDQKTQVYSRVVGYIRPIDNWNVAKRDEFEQRKTYNVENKKVDDEQE